jgi:steroid 5-alpha reductase family enzyme
MLVLLLSLVLSVVAMSAAWVVARAARDGGWVDAIWALAVGLIAAGAALWPAPEGLVSRQALTALLIGVWGLRLGGYIALRTAASDRPDPRYERFVARWGGWNFAAWRFLMIQAATIVVLVLAVRAAAVRPEPALDFRDLLAAGLVVLAVAGEALADHQMARFRRDPANRGMVADRGLWGWSRHPNYFFEWLVWLAWPVMALDPAAPASLLTLPAAAMMWWLLNHVSGVPMLEAEMLRSRPEAYRAYQARVSRFIPLPPKAR